MVLLFRHAIRPYRGKWTWKCELAQEEEQQVEQKTKENKAQPKISSKPETNGENPKLETKKQSDSKQQVAPVEPQPQPQQKQGETATREETPAIFPKVKGERHILKGGIVIQDPILGKGRVAKPGKRLTVSYTGWITKNRTKFDSQNLFAFRLGLREVVRGWDIGLVGMKEGGRRVLTVPASFAYGHEGADTIPPNSDLTFDIRLLQVQ
eukprot:c3430_g1_i1.p1 GENE.c3430_g1_i1~~c3430_g1_i1.p1  ORF type:complete len:209 (+),score=46.11 c3430_g1_i1:32-658(+)